MLTPLPAQNIDTGLGLNRLAAIMQGTTSVFETDQIRPLVTLGEELSGRTYGESEETDRALRILADHTRGMSFLVADGVVPSNEERGYVLRRLMRRAIVQGRRIGIEPGLPAALRRRRARADGLRLPRAARAARDDRDVAADRGGGVQPHARAGHAAARRRDRPRARRAAPRASAPIRRSCCTTPTASRSTSRSSSRPSRALGVDEQGFEELMDEQRMRARSAGRGGRDDERERIRALRRGGRLRHHVHGLRADRAGDRRRRGRRPRTAARCSSSSSRRSTRPAAARSPTPAWSSARTATAARAWSTSCGSATTRRWCSSPSAASCTRASASSRASIPRTGARPPATTPRRTCCTPRCARASARTCARPAPTSVRTSCASTSRTASR